MKKQTGQFSNFSTQRRLLWLSLCFIFLLFGCEEGTISIDENVAGPKTITIFVDGTSRSVTSEAGTVRQLLQEEAITVGDTDEVTPPLFTPLNGLESITIVRVNQSLEVIEESVPFGREFIRSDSMGTEDPARIIQGGRPGLQEVTVRIIFRDGVETERQIVNVNVIEEAVN
ncbi:MAG: G5 domain-containing protein [Anaerolineales bacterium]|nr:G5 domain-containing protein [Anaerolineales bacterium]